MLRVLRPLRIALYSHDTMGLGHMRRNLLLAQTLAGSFEASSIMMIAGARELNSFALPPGVDCLTLPSLHKDMGGHYHSRHLTMPLADLIEVRSQTIAAALLAFAPDLLIVDNVPRGAQGELMRSLVALQREGKTRCVLGLRDVLDEPAIIHQEWAEAGNDEVIRRFYDVIWVYGDPKIYDLVRELGLAPDVAAKVKYTGYLDARQRLNGSAMACPAQSAHDAGRATATSTSQALAEDSRQAVLRRLNLPPGRLAVCLLGGGQDGALLAQAFVRAPLPKGMIGLLITGPHLPAEIRAELTTWVAARPQLRLVEFLSEPMVLLGQADRVIAMGGYNTVMELLSLEKHALVVPRVFPRREQIIRAERLQRLGLIDMLEPDQVTPATLGDWLASDLGAPPAVHAQLNFTGLLRLPELVKAVLAPPAYSATNGHHSGGRSYASF